MARDRRRRSRQQDGDDTTPDVLGGATPYADEARRAEQGPIEPAAGGGGDDGDDYDRLPDLAEDEPERDPDLAPRKERGRALTFLRASAAELRRVEWPTRRHVFQATAVVLGFVVVAGAWLGLMDALWQPVMNAIL